MVNSTTYVWLMLFLQLLRKIRRPLRVLFGILRGPGMTIVNLRVLAPRSLDTDYMTGAYVIVGSC